MLILVCHKHLLHKEMRSFLPFSLKRCLLCNALVSSFFVFEILTDVSGDAGGSEHMNLQSCLTEALALA